MRKLAAALALLLCLAGCTGGSGGAAAPVSAGPAPAASGAGETADSASAPAFNYTGTVIQLALKDDSYGTPYYFLTVEDADGNTEALVSDSRSLPLAFEVGGHYRFRVLWGAARGNYVEAAEPAE